MQSPRLILGSGTCDDHEQQGDLLGLFADYREAVRRLKRDGGRWVIPAESWRSGAVEFAFLATPACAP
jgi:hypothetical protein